MGNNAPISKQNLCCLGLSNIKQLKESGSLLFVVSYTEDSLKVNSLLEYLEDREFAIHFRLFWKFR